MKALLCKEFGTADRLVLEEIADPIAGKGEVVVDVKAAGINFPDTLIIEGKYQFKPPFPFTPGGESSGVVSAVGDGVDGFAIGDRVIASMMVGGFAEKALAPAEMLTKIPDEMNFNTAAGFTVTYATSYHALKQRANLQAGETLLVLGAAGGVGLAAVELGKAMGAKVIAAASTDDKLEVCKTAGADEVINYSTENLKERIKELTGGKGADVIYDPVGGNLSEQALRGIAINGRFLVVGFAAGDIPKIPLNLTLLKQCQIVGVFWGAWARADRQAHDDNFAELLQMFLDGKLKPLVSQTFPLTSYVDAYACLTERRAKGKVILTMK